VIADGVATAAWGIAFGLLVVNTAAHTIRTSTDPLERATGHGLAAGLGMLAVALLAAVGLWAA